MNFLQAFYLCATVNALSLTQARSNRVPKGLHLPNSHEIRPSEKSRDDIGLTALERRIRKRKQTRYTIFAVESPAGHTDINFEATIKFVKTSLDLIAEFDHYPEIKFFVDRKHRVPTTNEELPYRYSLFSIDLAFNSSQNMHKITDFVKTSSDFMHADHMQIFVKTTDGRTVSLNVDSADTVENIKNRLRDTEGIPPSLQRLEYKGQTLADSRRLYDYHIRRESVIDLKHDIEINVRMSPTLVLTLKASPNDTVASVKAKLLEFGGYTIDRIKLEFAGQELQNEEPLRVYHVSNGSLIQATLKQATPTST